MKNHDDLFETPIFGRKLWDFWVWTLQIDSSKKDKTKESVHQEKQQKKKKRAQTKKNINATWSQVLHLMVLQAQIDNLLH